MKVFTIFNHGTGGWSGKSVDKAEIVNIFGNEYSRLNQEFVDYIITEGVGGKGDPQLLKLQHDHDTLSSTIDSKSKVKLLQNLKRVVYSTVGIGVKQNVANAITTLQWLEENGQCPNAINMIGWSRGAVTCIRIAYELSKLNGPLSTVPVNIFAVDPVAGGRSHHEDDAHTLTSNVKNYVATLALDEKRAGFTPVDHRILKVESASTNSIVLPLPGIHSDTAKYSNPAGRLTFHLCHRFLDSVGTRMPSSLSMFNMSDKGVLEQYNLLRKPLKSLHKSDRVKPRNNYTDVLKGGWNISGGRKKIELSDLTTDSDFFINPHHRAIFKNNFPVVYDAYFGAGRSILRTDEWNRNWLPRIMRDAQSMNLSPEEVEILSRMNTRTEDIYSDERREILNSLNLI